MNLMFDAFWRSVAYCLLPRVILLSLLPLLITSVAAWALGWFFWEPAVDGVSTWLSSWSLGETVMTWLDGVGASGFRAVISPLIVVAIAAPLLVIASLLVVAVAMSPAIVELVAKRRFPALERRQGEPAWRSVLWSLVSTIAAVALLVASMPLWLIPPLVLVLPPLIWGWLSYRVMSFDALAEHASRDERRALMREHRWPLLAIGVVTGFLGAAPSLVWAVSAMALVLAPLLIVVSMWLYTLVFAFSCLWFTHYALAALDARRRAENPAPVAPDLRQFGALQEP
ncbi:EI24 domain-containing protein [Caldimonas sp. KR1-144]|uniref:EI24 domain-containing protein n=1 Tax=Caldimonas sp. KR1-144 TaxID=3400911 RepID=UPI003C10714F